MRKAAGPKGKAKAVRTARQQRRAMSPPELALWSVLRRRPDEFKFRRQHPLGDNLSLDFYCNDARLAIEVDGEAHNRGDQPARDEKRDFVLERFGIATLRLPAVEVLRNLDGVMLGVLAEVRARLPLHHPPKGAGVGALACPRQAKIVSGGHDLAPTPPPRDELGED